MKFFFLVDIHDLFRDLFHDLFHNLLSIIR